MNCLYRKHQIKLLRIYPPWVYSGVSVKSRWLLISTSNFKNLISPHKIIKTLLLESSCCYSKFSIYFQLDICVLILEQYNINRDRRLTIHSPPSQMKKHNHLPLLYIFFSFSKMNTRDSKIVEKRSSLWLLKHCYYYIY